MINQNSYAKTLAWPTLGFFIGFAGLSIYGPLVPKFIHLMHLTPLDAGLLAAIANLSGSLLRLPFGAWADRRGFKLPFLTLLTAAVLGLLGIVWVMATHYPHHMNGLFPLLLILGFLVGAGIATFPVGIAQVSQAAPHTRQGTALALYAGLGNLAPGIFALLLPFAFAHIGLIPAYSLWALLMLIGIGIYARESPSVALLKPNKTDSPFLTALRTAATWPLTFLYFISFGGFLALVAWLPSFWVGTFHVPLVKAGLFTLLFTLTTSLIRIVGGWLADRISPTLVIAGSLLAVAFGAAFVTQSGTVTDAMISVLLIAVGMGIQNGAVFKIVPFRIPHAVGGAAGIIGGLGALGGFIIPPVMAMVGGVHHAPSSFIILTILALMGLGALVYLNRPSLNPQSLLKSETALDLDLES